MTATLSILLRVAGAMLLLLAAMHGPISRRLKWGEESLLLSPVNAAVFRVHALFICLILVVMGLPCIADPWVFLEKTRAGAWLAWTFAAFWTARLYAQWFVFPRTLWVGKRFETKVHFLSTTIWIFLAGLFFLCGARQVAWLR
jgi:hypothetical protein